MNNHNDIEKVLAGSVPTLLPSERALLWASLSSKLEKRTSVPSPFTFYARHTYMVVSAALVVALVLGGGGTALASNAARPGDLLFPIDRVIENTHLSLLRDENSRNILRAQLSEERIIELREILDEESVSVEVVAPASEGVATGTLWGERGGKKLRESGEGRVGLAVNEILSFLDETHADDDSRVRVFEKVFGEIEELSLSVDVDDSRPKLEDGGRVEIRRDESRGSSLRVMYRGDQIRFEKKNDEIRFRNEVERTTKEKISDQRLSDDTREEFEVEVEGDEDGGISSENGSMDLRWNDDDSDGGEKGDDRDEDEDEDEDGGGDDDSDEREDDD